MFWQEVSCVDSSSCQCESRGGARGGQVRGAAARDRSQGGGRDSLIRITFYLFSLTLTSIPGVLLTFDLTKTNTSHEHRCARPRPAPLAARQPGRRRPAQDALCAFVPCCDVTAFETSSVKFKAIYRINFSLNLLNRGVLPQTSRYWMAVSRDEREPLRARRHLQKKIMSISDVTCQHNGEAGSCRKIYRSRACVCAVKPTREHRARKHQGEGAARCFTTKRFYTAPTLKKL
ncbi:hypothetical protein EVAR_79127_1 [Eumeta japonica]|uniref:Uncharacterized protein n=1 Tax=Eumeta variegata TaxID=151549 RepID=A0A4C1UT13_EUMVA|nr:hypothetical protein EVAR_79127_1 [Eumeta japonica]